MEMMVVGIGALLAWALIRHDLAKEDKLHREEDADEGKREEL